MVLGLRFEGYGVVEVRGLYVWGLVGSECVRGGGGYMEFILRVFSGYVVKLVFVEG